MWHCHNSTTLYRGRRNHRTNKETFGEPRFPRRPLALSALQDRLALKDLLHCLPHYIHPTAALLLFEKRKTRKWFPMNSAWLHRFNEGLFCVCVCLCVCACIEKIAAAEGVRVGGAGVGVQEWAEKGSLSCYLLRCKCLLEVMVCVITTQLLCDAGWQLSRLNRILAISTEPSARTHGGKGEQYQDKSAFDFQGWMGELRKRVMTWISSSSTFRKWLWCCGVVQNVALQKGHVWEQHSKWLPKWQEILL